MSSVAFAPEQAPSLKDYAKTAFWAARAALEGNITFARQIAKAPVEVAPRDPGVMHRLSEFAYNGLARISTMRHRHQPRHATGQPVSPMRVDIAPAGGVIDEASITQVEHPYEQQTPVVTAESVQSKVDTIVQAAQMSVPPGFE